MKKIIIIMLLTMFSNNLIGQELSIGLSYLGYNKDNKVSKVFGGSVMMVDPITRIKDDTKLILGSTFLIGKVDNFKGIPYLPSTSKYFSIIANAGVFLTQNNTIDIAIIAGLGMESIASKVNPRGTLETRFLLSSAYNSYVSIGYDSGGNILAGAGFNIPW